MQYRQSRSASEPDLLGKGDIKEDKYGEMHILHAQVSRSVWAKQAIQDIVYTGAISSRRDLIELYEVASPNSSFFPQFPTSAGALGILDLTSMVAGSKDCID